MDYGKGETVEKILFDMAKLNGMDQLEKQSPGSAGAATSQDDELERRRT